jgi:hypothetical protein
MTVTKEEEPEQMCEVIGAMLNLFDIGNMTGSGHLSLQERIAI